MKPLIDRFNQKYQNHKSGCWIWTATKNNKGYGMIYPGYGKNKASAHRVSYELHVGRIPPGIHVLHKCDNPGCVNPDHLFLGTHRDNMRDKEKKGRANHKGAAGTANSSAILTDTDVIEIRRLYSSGEKRGDIASRFGVSYTCVADIIQSRSWAHLPNTVVRRKDLCTKLTESDVKEIKELLGDGVQGKDVAAIFGVHKATISDIKTRKTWSHL